MLSFVPLAVYWPSHRRPLIFIAPIQPPSPRPPTGTHARPHARTHTPAHTHTHTYFEWKVIQLQTHCIWPLHQNTHINNYHRHIYLTIYKIFSSNYFCTRNVTHALTSYLRTCLHAGKQCNQYNKYNHIKCYERFLIIICEIVT